MAERGTCWSLTINNPTDEDMNKTLPPGWRLEGQIEQASTKHFQGMLITPKIAFTTVKQYFPRAHIEKARKKVALQKYVHKSETRLTEFTQKNRIPTIFEFQEQIAGQLPEYEQLSKDFTSWFVKQYEAGGDHRKQAMNMNQAQYFMKILDEKTNELIEAGERGLEFVAINPMWRSSWLRFYKGILNRHKKHNETSHTIEPDGELHEGEPAECSSEDGTDQEEEECSPDETDESGSDEDSEQSFGD